MTKLPDIFVEDRKLACKNCVCNADVENPCSKCFLGKWGPRHCYESFIDPELKPEKEIEPSLLEMAKNFVKSSKEEIVAIKNKTPRLKKEESNNRMDICKQCEFFQKSSQRCTKCGCYMPIKTSWRSQKCPIGKW